MLKIAVDAIGGDYGYDVTVPACIQFLQNSTQAELIVVGDRAQIQSSIKKQLQRQPNNKEVLGRLNIKHTDSHISMDQTPSSALKNGNGTSMWLCVEEVKSKNADAAVSAGNTGALMALSRYVIKTIEGVTRPAIASTLPNINGKGTTVLDLGANIECDPNQLVEFAMMGSALASSMDKITNPSVGLLNVGTEVTKGNQILKETASMLSESEINFKGNVEGTDIFLGSLDVIVCDGFAGNVALKSSEGVAQLIQHHLQSEFKKNIYSKVTAFFCLPVLKRVATILDHRRFNGAALVGLDGIVFKSHGSADIFAFKCALQRAADAIENDLNGKIRQAFLRSKFCNKHGPFPES